MATAAWLWQREPWPLLAVRPSCLLPQAAEAVKAAPLERLAYPKTGLGTIPLALVTALDRAWRPRPLQLQRVAA